MQANQFFQLWVANTCFQITGIWPDSIDLDREWALTYAQNRPDITQARNCKIGYSATIDNEESMRLSMLVSTDKRVIH